jgi:hypothetical protein
MILLRWLKKKRRRGEEQAEENFSTVGLAFRNGPRVE